LNRPVTVVDGYLDVMGDDRVAQTTTPDGGDDSLLLPVRPAMATAGVGTGKISTPKPRVKP